MSEKHIPITPQDSAILLIDHQPGVLNMVNSVPRDQVAANVGVLARLGEQTELPIVISSTREELEFLGTNIDEIRTGAPTAYANRIARGGTLNAFADPRFVDAVKATGRQNLIMAGILTDVCLWHSAVSALEAGYHVRVIADANGTTSELADRVTYDRLRELGVEVGTTYGTLFELFADLSTPEGQLAEAIASGQQLAPAA
jgi:nicotinamidase-related amidase